jgi:hypothetical protein
MDFFAGPSKLPSRFIETLKLKSQHTHTHTQKEDFFCWSESFDFIGQGYYSGRLFYAHVKFLR